MATTPLFDVALIDLNDGDEADLFLLLSSVEELKTRDGKPYLKITLRDATREVSFPIWSDTPWYADFHDHWSAGEFFKVRGTFRETDYGPQIDIRKIRPIEEADKADGFDPSMCLPSSRFNAEEMFTELTDIAREQIADEPMQQLVLDLLEENRDEFMTCPAATRNHHAFASGLLEHVLSVVRTCVYLADKYSDYYPDMSPPLNRSAMFAGAILHDIGKLREYDVSPQGAEYSASGHLIGHILQGRDMLLEAARDRDLDPELLLRVEHVIVSHQRLPEWGSPKTPMTPEAMLVHYADDMDAKYHMMVAVLREETGDAQVTSRKNRLYQNVYRGQQES